MHLCLVSYHPDSTLREQDIQQEARFVGHYAMALAQQGHGVMWVTSTEALPMWAEALKAIPMEGSLRTCRHVVPCHAYRLAAVQVLAIDAATWQQRDQHTRLFTFLCLLQRALSWEVMHLWGDWAGIYLGVYTARFLEVSVVVSYGPLALSQGPHDPFTWRWVARQGTQALVTTQADGAFLLAHSPLTPSQLHIVSLHLPAAVHQLAALYMSLTSAQNASR